MSEQYDDDHDEASYADRICDSECMGVNHCGGHVVCHHCGDVVCGCDADPDTGLCVACYENRMNCENCGEHFFRDEGVEDDNGNWFCCTECADEYAHDNNTKLRCDVCGKEFPEDHVIDGCCKKCLELL